MYRPQQRTYSNGQRSCSVDDGMLTYFFAYGLPKAQGPFDGELYGLWEFYKKDGTFWRSATYDKGQRTGDWSTKRRENPLL